MTRSFQSVVRSRRLAVARIACTTSCGARFYVASTALAPERIATTLTAAAAAIAIGLGILGLSGALADAARMRRRDTALRATISGAGVAHRWSGVGGRGQACSGWTDGWGCHRILRCTLGDSDHW